MRQPDEHADPLVRRVARHVDANGLIAPRATVLAGVSGGADSVAMLSMLRTLSAEPGRAYHLTVAHLDHALREDSAADASWVADLARRWSLPCIVRRFDVGRLARRRRQGVEEAARAARLALFRGEAARIGAASVAVGHHADDNVETVFYRIVRGTHLQGLAGMAPSRRLAPNCALIRPMLCCTRSEIRAYGRRAALRWRTDPTNAQTAYRRNVIRHELLPLLREKLNPQADRALGRLASAARQAAAVLDNLAGEVLASSRLDEGPGRLALDVSALAEQQPAVTSAALRLALVRLGVPLRQVGAERMADLAEILSASGGAVSLPGGFEARCRQGRLLLQRSGVPGERTDANWPEPIRLDLASTTALPDGRQITCRIEPHDRQAFAAHCLDPPAGTELLDADRIGGVLQCGPRREGERFHPLGAPGRQTVGQFLTNLKVHPAARREVVCVRDVRGIVYLAPLRIDERVKVTQATRRILRIAIGPGEKKLPIST